MMWRFLTILVGVLAVGCVPVDKEIVRVPPMVIETSIACAAQTNIDPQHVLQIVIKAETYKGEATMNRGFQEFLFCVFNKFHYIKKDGHLKGDKFLNFFPEAMNKDPVKKVADKCNELIGDDGPHTIFKVFGCFILESPVEFIL